jgi:hemerythrin
MDSIVQTMPEVLVSEEPLNDSTGRMDMAIAWDKSLVTGSLRIDRHHQELFRQINALSVAVKQGKGRDLIRRLLDFLGQYVIRHFDAEERLMEELNCPAAAANKQAHAQFLSTYNSLRKQFDEAGAWPVVVAQIHDLLSEWLVQHISEVDVQLRVCCDEPVGKPRRDDRKSCRCTVPKERQSCELKVGANVLSALLANESKHGKRR